MASQMVKDPVCGMDCDIRTSDKVEYKGQTYYFCNPGCKQQFEKNPEQYVRHAQTGGRHHEMGHGGHH